MEDSKAPKKNNFPELEEDEEDDDNEQDFEISAKFCPYLQARSFFQRFFPKNVTLEYLENFEKYHPHSKYLKLPDYIHLKNKAAEKAKKDKTTKSTKFKKPPLKCPFGYTSSSPFFSHPTKMPSNSKCPFGFSSPKEESKDLNEINIEDENDSDSGDEIPRSGCPVTGIGKHKADPGNKDFEPHYEVPLYGPYDFLFTLKGNLEEDEWKEKTKTIRNIPRHLKYTLFYQNQKELENIHKLHFPKVFFMFDELKQKGLRYYNRCKYREALEYFNYAYGLLKWIEFKDKERQKNFIIKPSMNAILDSDIEIKKCYMDDPKAEEESYKSCVVYILLVMAYCFIELRHYSSAINCLNECEEEAGDLVPDVFLRRAQAYMSKKNANKFEMKKAEEDLEKAIILGKKFNEELAKEYDEMHPVYRTRYIKMDIYYSIKKKFEKICKIKLDDEMYKVRRIIGSICDEDHKNMKHEEAMLIEGLVLSKKEDIYRYYKVYKEMKKQYKQIIKYFSETNNPKLMDVTYDEYEKFMDSFEKFKFYYNFEFDNIDPKAFNNLTDEEKNMINDESKNEFYIKRLMHLCENLYSHGYYNLDVFQYSLETVLEEEVKETKKEEKKENVNKSDSFLMNISKGKFGFYMTIGFIILTIVAIGSQLLV